MKNLLILLENLLKRLRELKFTQPILYNLDLKYFKLSEFDCPCCKGSGEKMDKKFLEKLDYARHNAQIPFKINSAYRCESRNTLVGGRWGSSHKKGLAADIGYTGSRERYIILNSLLNIGITRIGISNTFVHCDLDNSKDQDVIWLYK